MVYEEPDVMRQVIRHACLTRRHLVRVVGDNVQLPEPLVVDERRCADLGTILDIVMSIDVRYRLAVRRIAEQLHGVGDDALVGIDVSSTSSGRYGFSEPLKAGIGFVRDDLVHAIDYETVREVPSQQRCGEQELDAVKATHEHATWFRQDVVFFSVLTHIYGPMSSLVTVVFLNTGCISAKYSKVVGNADVAFNHAEQRAVDNCCDDLLLRHLPFLTGWRVSFAFPRALPHFDHFHVTSEVGCVLFRVGQKRGHGLVVLRIRFLGVGVAFRATVPETSVELIGGARLSAPPINQEFPYPLLPSVALMADGMTGRKRHRS